MNVKNLLRSEKRETRIYKFLIYNHSFLRRPPKCVEKNTNKVNTKLSRKDTYLIINAEQFERNIIN